VPAQPQPSVVEVLTVASVHIITALDTDGIDVPEAPASFEVNGGRLTLVIGPVDAILEGEEVDALRAALA
jgi:hypothetical protein